MAFRLLQKWREDRRAEFMENIRPEFDELRNRPEPITLAEYHEIRANSFERKHIFPRYDNETLLHVAKYCYGQSRFSELGEFELSDTYDRAIVGEILPELLRRFEAMIAKPEPEKVRVVRWPDGTMVLEDDFRSEEWGYKSDDYEIVDVPAEEYDGY